MAKRRAETIHFETRALEKIPTPPDRITLYDSLREGLGIVIHPSGSKIFFWLRRVGPEHKHKWVKLGKFPSLTVASARAAAEKLNAAAEDWQAHGFVGKPPRLTTQSDMTLGEANESYCENHLRRHAKNKARRVKETKALFKNHLDHWKDRKLRAITRQDVRDLHAKIHKSAGMYAANYVAQHLRALINWCIDQELFNGENPAKIRRLQIKEEPRTRFLQHEEMQRFYASLDAESNVDARDFILLALYTGQRKGDLQAMSWSGPDDEHPHRSRVSLKASTWTIPNPKNQKVHTVFLTPEAREILDRRAKTAGNSPWVFPSSTSKTGHVVDFKAQWERVRTRAKLDDVRFHDLRHTFASWLAARNASLLVIQKAIGHQSQASTGRYAHVDVDPVRAAMLAATAAMRLAGKTNRKQLTAGKASRSVKRLKAAPKKAGAHA